MFLGDIFSFGWGEVFFSGRKGGKGRHKSTIIIRVKGHAMSALFGVCEPSCLPLGSLKILEQL